MAEIAQAVAVEGSVVVVHRSSRLLRTRIAGNFANAQAAVLLDVLEGWMGTTREGLVAFHDCREVTKYDVSAREKITAWSNAHIEPFAMVHILVLSRPVAWGIRIMAAILGSKIVAYHSPEAFEATFQRSLRAGKS